MSMFSSFSKTLSSSVSKAFNTATSITKPVVAAVSKPIAAVTSLAKPIVSAVTKPVAPITEPLGMIAPVTKTFTNPLEPVNQIQSFVKSPLTSNPLQQTLKTVSNVGIITGLKIANPTPPALFPVKSVISTVKPVISTVKPVITTPASSTLPPSSQVKPGSSSQPVKTSTIKNDRPAANTAQAAAARSMWNNGMYFGAFTMWLRSLW